MNPPLREDPSACIWITSASMGSIDFSHKEGDPIVDLTGVVHQLPCCIKHDGPTSVSHYFKPKSTEVEIDGLKVEEASFRGRKLQGTTLNLPQGYSGFILGKKIPGNEWGLKAKFGDMTIWNHDCFPSKDDGFIRAFQLFNVAKLLHQPVTPQQLEASNFSEDFE